MKLSDELVSDARRTAEAAERSISGQIEFWAQLGRSVELLLNGAETLALRKSGETVSLSHLLSTVDAPAGRERTAAYLKAEPFPHYEAAPDLRGMVVRIEANGKRTVGKFVNGTFHATGQKPRKSSRSRKKSPPRARSGGA